MSLDVQYDLPIKRVQYAAAYDSDRNRLVLFGGSDSTFPFTFYNDTWEFDGVSWSLITTATSPTPRRASVIAYDSARKVMVMFTGVDGTTLFDETWEYDGDNWTLQSPTASPGGRNTTGMVYDSNRGVMVLFGGQKAGFVAQNDTWEYDGNNWSLITTATLPLARTGEGLSYDSDRKKVVLFGGLDGGIATVYGDTWEYDGTDWTLQTPVASPPATIGHGIAFDPSIRKTVMFGGIDATFLLTFGETWIYDGTTWIEYTGISSPLPRVFMQLVYDSTRERLFVFGGNAELGSAFTYLLQQDTWEFNASTPDPWREVSFIFNDRAIEVSSGARPASGAFGWVSLSSLLVPPVRTRGRSVYDSVRNRIVLFGGMGATVRLNDTWEWDGYEWILISTVTSPPIREAHSMVFDTLRSRVVMFGGLDTGGARSDTWIYDGTDWTSLSPGTSPPGREDSAIGYDTDRDRIVLFGGLASGSPLADTWEFDGSTWEQVFPATSPSARTSTMSAYDDFRKRLIIFGGQDVVPVELAETWEFDGNDWAQVLPTTSPTARTRGTGVYNPTDRRFIIFGGTQATPSTNLDDTWEFDGATWTDLTITSLKPSARDGSSIAYDVNREAIVLHGGGVLAGVGSLSDTLGHPAAQNPKILDLESVATGPIETFAATVTATDPDKVNFTIVVNNIQRWYDGTSWTRSDGSFARSNSAAIINTNAASLDLDVGDLLQVCAILHSDNGLTFPEVDDVTITFGTVSGVPPGAAPLVSISENPLSNIVVEMSVGTVLTSGAVTKILVTLKSVNVLTPSSTQFITSNNLIPEILVKAGLPEDASFTTLNETSTGTQGDLFIVEVELTP